MATPQEDEELQLRRFIIQEIAHMVSRGIKGGVFEDYTVAIKISDRFKAHSEKVALEARVEQARYIQREFFDGEEYYPNELAAHIRDLQAQLNNQDKENK